MIFGKKYSKKSKEKIEDSIERIEVTLDKVMIQNRELDKRVEKLEDNNG